MATDDEIPADAPANGVIDWGVLGALKALRKPGSPDPLGRIIAVYLDSAAELMEGIREAIRESDGQALMKSAHSLKSASMNVGATGFAAMCAELERIGRARTLRDLGDLPIRTEKEYAAAVAALREALR